MIIYRDGVSIKTISVDNKTQLKQTLLGENKIQADFTLEQYFNLEVGDYIIWEGQQYTILKQPSVNKIKTNQFKYNFDLESYQYKLMDSILFFDNQGEFSLMGDLTKFANLIIENLNRTNGPGSYSVGTLPETESKNITFQSVNCYSALQTIAKEFDLEYIFSVDGTIINFATKIGIDTGLSFEFKAGLRNIERKKIADKNIITSLYAFGGNRNIPNDYGSKKLKINVLQKNTGIFGVIEGIVNFDDVYPKREGLVSHINTIDGLKFKDTSIDFNVNDQLIEGVTAKVTFNSGYLSGYEFDIHNFNNATKEFDLISYQDSNGLAFPNDTLGIQISDKYIIHGISMPEIYVTNAESKLLVKAQEYLDENSLPNVIYSVIPDFTYLRANSINLNIGDVIEIKDTDFGLTYETRIISLTQSIANPYLYSIQVGDRVSISYINRVINDQNTLNNTIYTERENRIAENNRIRRNLANIDALKDLIFDQDGYFDTDNIKPLSIETSMLSVGSKGQQFILRDLLIESNYQGNSNKINLSSGTLVHFTIAEENKQWEISGDLETLTDNKAHYIYAKCVKNSTTGTLLVTQDQYSVDEGLFYYFLIGVLHEALDNIRGISLTYGQTSVNGKFITTGRIQSSDGYNFFDLDDNAFQIGSSTSGIDWNVTNSNRLTIKGGIVQSPSGIEFPLSVYRGAWNSSTKYHKGDQVSYQGGTYIYTNNTPTAGHLPTEITWFDPVALAGLDGSNGETGPSIVYRGEYQSNVAYFRNTKRRDVVKHNSNYWLKKEFFDGGTYYLSEPFNASKWENFGAQLDSVATNLLLAENANIADWILKDGQISSQSSVGNVPKVILDGQNGAIKMRGLTGNPEYLGKSEIKDEGVFIESEGDEFTIPQNQTGATWIGGNSTIVQRYMPNSFNDGNLLTAVYGKATNTSSTGCRTFGGYFINLMARGLFTKVKRSDTTSTFTFQKHDVSLFCTHTSGTKNVYLPTIDYRERGRILIIKSKNHTLLHGNGKLIDGSTNISLNWQSDKRSFQFDGYEWHSI